MLVDEPQTFPLTRCEQLHRIYGYDRAHWHLTVVKRDQRFSSTLRTASGRFRLSYWRPCPQGTRDDVQGRRESGCLRAKDRRASAGTTPSARPQPVRARVKARRVLPAGAEIRARGQSRRGLYAGRGRSRPGRQHRLAGGRRSPPGRRKRLVVGAQPARSPGDCGPSTPFRTPAGATPCWWSPKSWRVSATVPAPTFDLVLSALRLRVGSCEDPPGRFPIDVPHAPTSQPTSSPR